MGKEDGRMDGTAGGMPHQAAGITRKGVSQGFPDVA